jgi:hypothetical protein
MYLTLFRSAGRRGLARRLGTGLCAFTLAMQPVVAFASGRSATATRPTKSHLEAPPQDSAAEPKIPADQLDALVAPIALFPDPMLSQTLVASTYPLEIIQLQQWLAKNPNLKDQALVDAVQKQPWDASIQAMAALPDLVKRLSDDIQWTTDLGNAFLAQQTEVMDAVQRMRKKAQDKGALATNEQQKVETQVVENKQVIVVEQANPQVVYVPSYDPVYAYGPPVYPYPPIYYPPYSAGAVVAAGAISFGIGVAMGAAWGGGWGWGCGWGGGDVNINTNNNFNRNTNINGGNRNNINGGNRGNNAGGKWSHNPSHRGGAPYGNRSTADKFGGTARGDSLSNRQQGARDQVGRQNGNLGSQRDSKGSSNRASTSDRSSGAGSKDRGGSGDRSSSNRASTSDRSSSGAGSGDRGSRGSDSIGSRDVSRGSSSKGSSSSAFGGGSGGFGGSSSKSSSSRGSSSMSGSRGGGGGGGSRGGGGGGGGGGRGGGGGGGRR